MNGKYIAKKLEDFRAVHPLELPLRRNAEKPISKKALVAVGVTCAVLAATAVACYFFLKKKDITVKLCCDIDDKNDGTDVCVSDDEAESKPAEEPCDEPCEYAESCCEEEPEKPCCEEKAEEPCCEEKTEEA
ncbi:MAG: hypothetical protein GX929_04315 [Clostridiales bacterium]|nr:hypothetical protein [Clostridiales bacterium]